MGERDCTSARRCSASLVHTTRGRPLCRPHNTVPRVMVGLSLRRQGPGVHSPTRQMSTQPIMIARQGRQDGK